MRIRKKKNLDYRMALGADYIVEDPARVKGGWRELFGKDAPLFVEIGCGKGGFILGMAALYPERCFMGVERSMPVLALAAEKAANAKLDNLRLMLFDAAALCDILSPGEADGIYLNFSDPWPKKRHTKRRLTAASFLDIYKTVLAPGGCVFLKTDNAGLFEFSLETLAENGFRLENVTWDLHASPTDGNVMTEYEAKFVNAGKKICRLEARCKL